MNYTEWYTDENGTRHSVTITEEDSIEALRNDLEALMKRYVPNLVRIERLKAEAGEMLHLRVTVKALSHYLTSLTDTSPKLCSAMSFDAVVYMGYPLTPVKIHYPQNHYLASSGVFKNGHACIDTWKIFTSSLLTAVDKVIRDIVHDPDVNPDVTNHKPTANSAMDNWFRKNVEEGRFPTIQTSQFCLRFDPPGNESMYRERL